MTPDGLAISAALVVPVLTAEIEGERERGNPLGYGGGDVVPVETFVELQRSTDHEGWKAERELDEPGVDPAVITRTLGACECRYSADPICADNEAAPPETKH